jgi:teichuronic acid biosynthesis glycosyltransferase TuaG
VKKVYQDLVSIITPAFNCEAFIAETINSVLSQKYSDWEMIIVNDHSSDKTKEIISSFKRLDSRIKLINLAENAGAAVARNTGLAYAKGRYIAFLDSDDRWKGDKLDKQLSFMKNNNYGFTFTAYEYIRDDQIKDRRVFEVPSRLTYRQALKHTVIGCLTVIIDREIVGDFRMPLVRRGQDNLTWLSILKKGHVAYGINENLAEYRRVAGSLSNNKFKALKRQWHNYRYELKLPLFTCIYYYVFYVINNIRKYYFHS